MRRSPLLACLALLSLLSLLVLNLPAPPAAADHVLPPGIPATSTAKSQLAALTVRSEGSGSGYDRSLFPHWVGVDGNCNAREYVLKRDGHTVQVDGACRDTSGRWSSPYDGVWTGDSSTFDIDHMVALAEAWRSGANTWSAAKRQSFANNVNSPQLWAVTASSNRSKGDNDPAEWLPPRTGIHCAYVKAWTNVKYRYGLSINSAEKSAITNTINSRC